MLTTILICAALAVCLTLGVAPVRVRLIKSWEFEGEDFDAGTELNVDPDTAADLTKKGFVKAGSEAGGDGDDGKNKNKGKASPEPKDKGVVGDTTKGKGSDEDPELIKKMAGMLEDFTKRHEADNRTKVVVHEPGWTKMRGLGYAKSENPTHQIIGRGRFLQDLVQVGQGTPRGDPRLKQFQRVQDHLDSTRVKALGSDEYAAIEDTIGGFFIQPDFDDRLLTKGFEAEWVRANGAVVIPTNSTMLKINAEVDTDRRTNLYGGIAVAFQSERELLTSSRGKFEQIELKPDWLTGLYFATETILRSAPALGAIVGRQFQNAFQRRETLAFTVGTGAGEPLGVIPSAAAKTISRATANEIAHEDVISMRARQWDYANSVWVAAMGTYEQLANMAKLFTIENQAGSENVGGSGTLTWQQQLVTGQPQTLLGRPLIFTEHLPALGTKGDLINVAWNHYLIAESTDFINDSSIHIRFDSLETAFRFAKRIDGQPWWRATILVQNAYEMSPFILLN